MLVSVARSAAGGAPSAAGAPAAGGFGTAVGAGAIGLASAANAQAHYAYGYGPVVYEEPRARGVVYAAPSASCHWMRVQREDGRMIRQRVCD